MSTNTDFRLVIADDSLPVRNRLAEMLTLPGIAVVGLAPDAPASLRVIKEQSPDAVVLDLHMPGGGGFAVLEGLKKLRPAPIALVLTNYADEHYRAKSKAAGAAYFFDKSSEFEDAVDILKELARNQHRTNPPVG